MNPSGLQFDGQRAKQYVEHLSSDALEGRMTCTEGYRKAADWAAERFKSWGLTPAGEEGTYFQQVTIRGVRLDDWGPDLAGWYASSSCWMTVIFHSTASHPPVSESEG